MGALSVGLCLFIGASVLLVVLFAAWQYRLEEFDGLRKPKSAPTKPARFAL